MTTGILDLSPELYHADPADRPSLSKSIAHLLCDKSPRHAREAHPKLNPNFERKDEGKFDLGTVAHDVLLEGRDILYVVHADDWRTKVAKEERDAARELGKVPLLAKDRDAVYAMVDAAREQLAALNVDPPFFTDGQAERTIVWEEDEVICRARLDWLRDDLQAIDDYKTTSASADPDRWVRTMLGIGGDLQAAFYRRGVKALTGEDAEFRFIVQETSPPYLLCPIALSPDLMAIAERKVEWAIKRWRVCLETGIWDGYPTDVCYVEAPGWEEARWMEREAREEVAA